MSDPNYLHSPTEGGPDDLPRTLRREREAREREARERAASQATATLSSGFVGHDATYTPVDEQAPAARLTQIDVPFFRLVAFFFKAAFAALPALLVLGAILWVIGHFAQIYFPQLVKMQVLIWFPNNT